MGPSGASGAYARSPSCQPLSETLAPGAGAASTSVGLSAYGVVRLEPRFPAVPRCPGRASGPRRARHLRHALWQPGSGREGRGGVVPGRPTAQAVVRRGAEGRVKMQFSEGNRGGLPFTAAFTRHIDERFTCTFLYVSLRTSPWGRCCEDFHFAGRKLRPREVRLTQSAIWTPSQFVDLGPGVEPN